MFAFRVTIDDILEGSERINKARKEIKAVVQTLLSHVNVDNCPEIATGEVIVWEKETETGMVQWILSLGRKGPQASIKLTHDEGERVVTIPGNDIELADVRDVRALLEEFVFGIYEKVPTVKEALQPLFWAAREPVKLELYYRVEIPIPEGDPKHGKLYGVNGDQRWFRRPCEPGEPVLPMGTTVDVLVGGEEDELLRFKVYNYEKTLAYTENQLIMCLRLEENNFHDQADANERLANFVRGLVEDGWGQE